MLKFKPISYADSDLRAVKFSSSAGASVREGHFCYVVNSDLHTMIATPITSAYTFATLPSFYISGTVTAVQAAPKGMYFPVFREDLDIENVGATIAAGNFCIAFNMRPGQEFDVHSSAIGTALANFTAVNQLVALGANGKLNTLGGAASGATHMAIGAVIGTFNGAWLRVRTI